MMSDAVKKVNESLQRIGMPNIDGLLVRDHQSQPNTVIIQLPLMVGVVIDRDGERLDNAIRDSLRNYIQFIDREFAPVAEGRNRPYHLLVEHCLRLEEQLSEKP